IARRAATTSTNSIRNEPNGSSWRDWSGWDLTLFCGTRLPTPYRQPSHHFLQAVAVAAPVNASTVELSVNTGSNKSSFSKDWPGRVDHPSFAFWTRNGLSRVPWRLVSDTRRASIGDPCLAPSDRRAPALGQVFGQEFRQTGKGNGNPAGAVGA